ncbi:MAG: HDIG domain-containing protein [Puniceicoccales bacterium]|nr:HDIG domain-containing protein [Puniceicoccales bacterium]
MFSFGKKSKTSLTGTRKPFHRYRNDYPFYAQRWTFFQKYLKAALAVGVISFFITAICFWKRVPLSLRFFPGQIIPSQIVAQIPFSYISTAETKRLITEKRSQLAPVYKVDLTPFEAFSQDLWRLNTFLETFPHEVSSEKMNFPELQHSLGTFNRHHQLKVDWKDITIILETLSHTERSRVFQESLNILQEIAIDGVFSENEQNILDRESSHLLRIEVKGQPEYTNIRSMENALRFLRIHLLFMDMEHALTQALFHIMKLGVRPNLIFDVTASEEKFQQLLATLPKVRKFVDKRMTLVSAGAILSNEDYEKLSAYYKALHMDERDKLWTNKPLIQDYVKTFIIIALSWIVISFASITFRKSKKDVLFFFTIIILNLSLLRTLLQLTEISLWKENAIITHVFLCLIPFSIGAILSTIFLKIPGGICCSALISVFYTLMMDQGIPFLLTCFLASLVATLACHSPYLRSHVFQAGILSGFFSAAGLVLFKSSTETMSNMPWPEVLASIASGILSSSIALGCLSFFERVFHYCSDITLFELYDYNHPLMQQLQILSSGTYHHSLVVSNIAEQAAVVIGANPILCKTAALYHDIGKIEKPEYFIENQHSEENFHESKKPELSAMIIKNHVRTGVILGKNAKLPQQILDIIQQHHGDSFVRFFHEKARSRQETDAHPLDEATFRYDGPKPQTKEAAVICLSDALEAVSRVLKKPQSLQNIEELVSHIIQDRVDEHQFDECPLTLQDLKKLQKAFSSILLGTIHTRISYDLENRQNSK